MHTEFETNALRTIKSPESKEAGHKRKKMKAARGAEIKKPEVQILFSASKVALSTLRNRVISVSGLNTFKMNR